MGLCVFLEEFHKLRNIIKKEIRRAKRGQEIALPDNIKNYIEGKRITREKMWPL